MSLFTDHPATVGESYGEHMMFAWRFSFRLFKAASKAFLHGLLPFAFETSASDEVKTLARELANRGSGAAGAHQAHGTQSPNAA
jgi:hypothetical protein